ncbi:MAG: segregation and condensation protein A [Alphaproteobacteria bacterium]
MATLPDFEEDKVKDRAGEGALVVDLEGFEGPIDMLLTLAREQKVDLLNISILQLADQYLSFISEARRLKLEVAADYLVMAAWLAYLKSRLLLPAEETEDEPSGSEMAEALAFQLRRLEAMQNFGGKVMALPRLGKDVFSRGAPEGVKILKNPVYDLSLYELLKSYGDQYSRAKEGQLLEIAPTEFYSVDDALERLRLMLGKTPGWTVLSSFLPNDISEPLVWRSALASTFAASLELAKSGQIEIQQGQTFGPMYLRSKVE